MATPTTAYMLDNQDRILSVSGFWDEFADENSGANLSSKDVCGRRIWDFVTSDVTRMWLASIFQLSRLRGTVIERPYRCDSPDLKRFMRMRIVSEQGGVLRIEHEILTTEQRPAPVRIQYSANSMENNMQRCSICGRVNNGGWEEPRAEHAGTNSGIIVNYTVCEDCLSLMPGK